MLLSDDLKKEYLTKYSSVGTDRFYKFLLSYAVDRAANSKSHNKINNPALELLEYYETFLTLYRREGEDTYLDIAKQFRRAANKIYRILRKSNSIKYSNKFLNLV